MIYTKSSGIGLILHNPASVLLNDAEWRRKIEAPLPQGNPQERRLLPLSIFSAPSVKARALIDPSRGAIRGASGSAPDSGC